MLGHVVSLLFVFFFFVFSLHLHLSGLLPKVISLGESLTLQPPPPLRHRDPTTLPSRMLTRGCYSLAWAEMYLILATMIRRFDFEFEGATAEDFMASSDQFIIGTKGKGVLKAAVRHVAR